MADSSLVLLDSEAGWCRAHTTGSGDRNRSRGRSCWDGGPDIIRPAAIHIRGGHAVEAGRGIQQVIAPDAHLRADCARLGVEVVGLRLWDG